jgi:mRNA interferase MazF
MKRGDVIVGVLPGDYGKPRPAVVVQSDLFNPTHPSVTICPISSHLRETELFRITLAPATRSGLRQKSQVMIDKLMTIRRERVGKIIGRLSGDEMERLDDSLRLWLALEL